MHESLPFVLRRSLLQRGLAGLVCLPAVADAAGGPAFSAAPAEAAGRQAKRPVAPTGRPGEFDFLTGEWRIRNQRLKSAGGDAWDRFESEASCWSILGGIASIEELRIPARQFSGMGLRLFDVEKKIWHELWMNARSGSLSGPGMPGGFHGTEAIFEAEDQDGDKRILVRSVWDRITPRSCRWQQAVSRDEGVSWESNWIMEWERVVVTADPGGASR
jgi:hypothetical protein